MRRKIAIDIDDVLADSTDMIRILVNERTGNNLTKEDYRVEADYRRYFEHVWQSHNMSFDPSELYAEFVIDQSHIVLVAGAEYAITELSKKFDIVLVTSRSSKSEDATRRWLKQHFGDILPELHFAVNDEDPAVKTKGQICLEIGAEWLIDDNPEHCQSALEFDVDAVLFGEYGWHKTIPDQAIRCKDWPTVLEYFNGK